MASISPTETLCHYVFGSEAEKIFQNVKIQNVSEKRIFIDKCLKLSIIVNSRLFEKDNLLPLYSSMAGNEGCLLYSDRVIELKKTYHSKNEENKLAATADNKFLLLSFFLSFMLLSDVNKCFIRVFKQMLKEDEELKPLKHFNAFLLDEGKFRENAAREEYNRIFKPYIQETLSQSCQEDEVYGELYKIAQEDLMKETESKSFKRLNLYTYPIFPTLIFIQKKIEKESYPFMIKIILLTKKGREGIIVKNFGEAKEEDPVLVLEGIGTGGDYNVPYFRQNAQSCPRYYHRYQNPRIRHKDDEYCSLCLPAPGDHTESLAGFHQCFKEATASIPTLFQALGVDSACLQHGFLPFFKNFDKYPELSKIFQTVYPMIEKLGLSMLNPITFSLCHAHVNTVKHASNDHLFLMTPPEEFLDREIFKK